MEATFIHNGQTIDYTPSSDVSAGTVVVIGNIVGVTKSNIAAYTVGALALDGVFDFASSTSVEFDAGDYAYWDDTNKCATSTAAGNSLIGRVVLDSATAAPIVRVRLEPVGPDNTPASV